MASMKSRLSQCISRSDQRWRMVVRAAKRGLAAGGEWMRRRLPITLAAAQQG